MKHPVILTLALSATLLLGNSSLSGNNPASAARHTYTVVSPDGKLKAEISATEQLSYSIILQDADTLVAPSSIGLTLDDGTTVGTSPRVVSTRKRRQTEQIEAPFYRVSHFTTTYNELDLRLKGDFGVVFRAYNEGIAYRFYTRLKTVVTIQDEKAEFNFPHDYTVYLPYSTNSKRPLAMAFQNTYDVAPLSKDSALPAFLPATVDYGNGVKLTPACLYKSKLPGSAPTSLTSRNVTD